VIDLALISNRNHPMPAPTRATLGDNWFAGESRLMKRALSVMFLLSGAPGFQFPVKFNSNSGNHELETLNFKTAVIRRF